MAKVAETATRARVKLRHITFSEIGTAADEVVSARGLKCFCQHLWQMKRPVRWLTLVPLAAPSTPARPVADNLFGSHAGVSKPTTAKHKYDFLERLEIPLVKTATIFVVCSSEYIL